MGGPGTPAMQQRPLTTYYGYGEVLLLLDVKHGGTHGHVVQDGDLDGIRAVLHGVKITRDGDDPFHANAFRGPDGEPRMPVPLARGDRGERTLVGVNLASWLDPHGNPTDSAAEYTAIHDVGVAVNTINAALAGGIDVGLNYTLAAASPNWLAHPFPG